MNNEILWQTKLAARVHDPAEKALVLLRDPAGHEGGTSRALARLLGLDALPEHNLPADSDEVLAQVVFKDGIPRSIYRHVRRADWWAAAADRPQWPLEEVTFTSRDGSRRVRKVADWAQVRWTQDPILIHPLTGDVFDLKTLGDSDFHEIKGRSLAHFRSLLNLVQGESASLDDLRKILLTFWRFGPELQETDNNDKLGALWQLLPADTRVPDHTIWDHLDLTSAFAGAFAADPEGEVALLALSIGPVQPFIAAARSTSDLWAGSHLLSRLAWEAMRPVCEQFGPDAILFPRLRGVPQVDLWLCRQMGVPAELFKACDWDRQRTDSNPLFSAALPNRFVAVVPARQAGAIAQQVEAAVREWFQCTGKKVVDSLLDVAGLAGPEEQHCHRQMREQLEGAPEVHWAIVPFSLIKPRNVDRQTDLDTVALSEAMAPFFGAGQDQECGFLASPAWQVLRQEACVKSAGSNTVFFAPNPGVLYPAVYDLAERVLAAAKAVRPFTQVHHAGWRCSLTGETEWLTTDPRQLESSYRKQTDTLWAKIAANKPAWAKKGEHLGALSAIKRVWPTLFTREVREALGFDVGRFVVSTHTMALAHQLDRCLEAGGLGNDSASGLIAKYQPESVALPPRLIRLHRNNPAMETAKKLPALLDLAADGDIGEQQAADIERAVGKLLDVRLETYYGLLLMDGDRMGQMLSGDEGSAITFLESFHRQVREGFQERAKADARVAAYGQQKRAISPGRHMAISGALNHFALTVVRHVVEHEYLGRVIYAGGDDVLAMLPVADLLPAMQRLRHAYSGIDPDYPGGTLQGLTLNKGFALLNGRLMPMMGKSATASTGAVIAHHQAPLAAVRRELEAAERRAKNEGGRDAFSLTVIKRSGGALRFTAKWGRPLHAMISVKNFLAEEGVSRRAVYNTLEWIDDIPEPDGDGAMLEKLLSYQLARQAPANLKQMAGDLARELTALTLQEAPQHGKDWLQNFLSVAEFLARETRTGGLQ